MFSVAPPASSTPVVRLPKSEWVLTPGAFEPIINHATYSKAQRILQSRTINQSDEELLDSLRGLLAKKGRLSLHLIKNSEDVPSPSTYRHRFGSLRRAYELIGYGRPAQFGPIDLRRRTQALREELISRIAAMFPDVSVVRRGGRCRSRLRLKNGLIVSVLVSRTVRIWKEPVRWRVDPIQHERDLVTLLARLDEGNGSFLDFHVLPRVDRVKRFDLRLMDSWLNRGQKLSDLGAFGEAVVRVRSESEADIQESETCGWSRVVRSWGVDLNPSAVLITCNLLIIRWAKRAKSPQCPVRQYKSSTNLDHRPYGFGLQNTAPGTCFTRDAQATQPPESQSLFRAHPFLT
jgi:hypothetical protein